MHRAQQLRKIQNRIAQREFRHRKQQYVKDLEARVELLSSSHDEQVEQLRGALFALINENKSLRSLLASLSTFVGEGLGGCLSQLRVDSQEFDALLHKADTDTVHDALAAYKLSRHNGTSASASAPVLNSSVPAGPSSGNKRKRASGEPSAPSSAHSATDSVFSAFVQPVLQGLNGFDAGGLPRSFPESPANANTLYPTSLPSQAPSPPIASSSSHVTQPQQQQQPPLQPSSNGLGDLGPSIPDFSPLYGLCTDNPRMQAIQLISYHLKNRRENPNYHLPPSLQPTTFQRTVPHGTCSTRGKEMRG
jgi:hypothetical protein